MTLLLLAFGIVAGVTTVLFGFGGGFIIVPVLYTLLSLHAPHGSALRDAAMQVAVATSTAVMVFGSSMATWRHQRAGTLLWPVARPLLGYIAIGAAVGAGVATVLSGAWVKWLFVGYLALTIVDAIARPGFLAVARDDIAPMGRLATAGGGVVIGAVAALLGVGGSVMTVPLMRRRGASMTAATAMASLLSLPMAVTGTVTYMLAASHGPALGTWIVGFVDVCAFLCLALGSWLGIRVTSRWIGRIPDTVHARVYVGLLFAMLLVMSLV